MWVVLLDGVGVLLVHEQHTIHVGDLGALQQVVNHRLGCQVFRYECVEGFMGSH